MKKHLPLFYLLIVLVVLTLAYGAMTHYSTEGYVLANVMRIEGQTIIIGHDCLAIVADTSPERAYSIQMGLDKKIENRPMTHDTFIEVIKSFNITLEAVKLQTFDGSYYYSDMILSDDEKVLVLDAMPSDAIALAVRLDVPIYLNQTLLEEIGQEIC